MSSQESISYHVLRTSRVPVFSPADIARFWSNVATDHTNKCWLWRGGSLHAFGYGQFSHKGRSIASSRVAYQLVYGPIPEGLVVRHQCDNPPCCNPLHLLTGTTQDNTKDRVIRGRTIRGEGVWHKVRLTEADVLRIRATPQAEWTALAKELGVARNTLFSAAIGQSWKHLPGAVTDLSRSLNRKLKADDVHYIRTAGLSDSHVARVLGVGAHVVRNARIGESWGDHPTPPDTRVRECGGVRNRPAEARFRSPPTSSGSRP